jgi:hypothetical protein
MFSMDTTVSGGFSEFKGRISSPALQAIAEHWQLVRADKTMPAWSDLSPSALSSHLKRLWAFNYDRATGDFTARLAGTRVMMGFGQSFRGTPLKDLHPPHVFQRCHANLTKAVSGPAIYWCGGHLFKVGNQVIKGERIVLPLASDGRHGDGVLGASDFQYPATTGPVELIHDQIEWFSI